MEGGSRGPVVGGESESSAAHKPVLDYAPQPRGRWSVGTLTYSARGLVILFILLLGGDFAYSMRERSVWPIIQIMLKQLHASDTMISLQVSTLPTILTLIVGPIISYRSDRYRSVWGRRIPFLIVSTPMAAGAMVGIAYTNILGAALQRSLHLDESHFESCALAVFTIFWTAFEVAAVISGTLLGALVNDVVPYHLLGRFFGMFRQISLGAGIIFNYWIVGLAETHYCAILSAMAVLFFAGFMVMCFTVREGEYPPPERIAVDRPSAWDSTVYYFRKCFGLRYYRIAQAGIALSVAAFVPVNLFVLIYATQIHVSMAIYGRLLVLSYFISFFLASPLGWLVDRLHTLRVTIATLVIYSVLMLLMAFDIHNTRTYGIALVLHTILSGCYYTVSSPIGQALFPRISYAQFAAATGIVQSIVTVLVGPALGLVLDWTRHDYRLAYIAGGVIGLLSILMLMITHRDFMRLGGPKNYVAPGDEMES